MSEITILDGGMGKELRRIGAPFRQPEWSSLALIEAPERVVEAHCNFIDAGAEIIITNNYAVVPFHHSDAFFAERGAELTALAGRLARQAAEGADHDVLVAGSMPPLFGSYEPDAFDAGRAAPIYRMIAESLAPHVDLWIAETLSTTAEVDAILAAITPIDDGRDVWVSFSVPDAWESDNGIALRSGESMDEVADSVDRHRSRVTAALVNCSLPEQTGPALAGLRAALDARRLGGVQTGGYANAFPTRRSDDYRANEVIFERRDELTGEHYADIVATWIDEGATIVGGCCDMYPEHIAALSARFG